MKKQRKSGTAHYFFLVYIIKEEKISDARFGTPAYCIETTVKTGRIFKINELCGKRSGCCFHFPSPDTEFSGRIPIRFSMNALPVAKVLYVPACGGWRRFLQY